MSTAASQPPIEPVRWPERTIQEPVTIPVAWRDALRAMAEREGVTKTELHRRALYRLLTEGEP